MRRRPRRRIETFGWPLRWYSVISRVAGRSIKETSCVSQLSSPWRRPLFFPSPPRIRRSSPEDSTVLLKDSFTEKCLDSDSGGKVYTNECHTDNGYQKWQWIEARAR